MIDLAPTHLEEIQRILAEHVPDCEVRAFGSRATWTAKDYSDLDLAVVGIGSLGASVMTRLRESFEESTLPIRVDVIDWDSLTDSFRQAIDGDCLVLQEPTLARGWRQVTLGEVVAINPKRNLKRGEEAPFVAMADVLEHQRQLPDVGAREFKGSGSRFRNGDTLLARITPCLENGKAAWISGLQDSEIGHGSTEFIVLSALEGITHPLFVYYFARHPHFREFAIGQMTGTSGRQRVPVPAIESYQFLLPPLDEQRRVAHILGTLDDKIELNRRMSETLEAMAQALFKSWFVDFDPVRAKAEGRPTGLPPDLEALFPDSFQDSELGEIPEGWEVGMLGDIAEERKRSVKPDTIAPSTPYISLAHMPQRSIALSQWDTADGIESGKSAFRRGEILFGKLRPYFHKVGIAPVDGVCSTDIVVAAPKSPEWFGSALGYMSSTDFVDYADAGSTGTRMPRTSWKRMAQYDVTLPPCDLARAFTTHAHPLIESILCATHDTHILSYLRDTLLLKLIASAGKHPV